MQSSTKLMYRSEIITRPDGSTYVQCVWNGSDAQTSISSEQKLTADQLKTWNTTE